MKKEYCDSCGKENKTSLWKGEELKSLVYDIFGEELHARICKDCAKRIFKDARKFANKEMK